MRLTKLEEGQTRLATILTQVVSFLDQAQKPAGQMTSPQVPVQGPGGLNMGNIGQMLPSIMKMAEGLFSGPQQPQVDPFQMELYKGMKDAFVEGFKSYIQTVNQNAQIGAEVVKAITAGKLKLETAPGAAA